MTIQDEISKLEYQLRVLRNKQDQCCHEWGEIEYCPFITKERKMMIPGRYTTHGVHREPIFENREVTKPRWSRACKKCGLVVYTEKQVAVTTPTVMVPDFK